MISSNWDPVIDDDDAPPLDDDDAPPPFSDDELDEAPAPEAATPGQQTTKKSSSTDNSLLGLESKIKREPIFQQTKDKQGPEPSAAHEALIANLAPKPKRGETAKKQAAEAEQAEAEYKAKAEAQKPIKKGFFDAPAPKKKKKKKKKPQSAQAKASSVSNSAVNEADDDDIIDIKTPGIEAQDAMGGLQLPEVQAAMAGVKAKQKEWMNPAFMERFMKNPRLMQGFKDPVCQQAMAEMQENPKEAAEKYQGNPGVTEFLKEFMGLMGDHFHNIAEEKEKEDVAKTEAAWPTEGPMADPEVKKMMTDPEFQPVLQDCQQPGRMMQHMHDPRYAPRLNFLISRGVFNVHA